MASIVVTTAEDKKKFQVLVDFIQRGVDYSTVALANLEAQRLHDNEIPHASLMLSSIN